MRSPGKASNKLPGELQKIYEARFSGREGYRNRVWQVLTSEFFSRWITSEDAVLDLGCGYCEFINNVKARKKFGIDLNPATRGFAEADVHYLGQDCSERWALADDTLDAVFSSNFFEHLLNKELLQATLFEAHRCLKPGGYLIAVGPNIRAVGGKYWDFFDHHIELTERSLSELLYLAGYEVEISVGRFLPYSMSQGFQPPIWSLRLYLKLRFLWVVFGRQFLVVARKTVV